MTWLFVILIIVIAFFAYLVITPIRFEIQYNIDNKSIKSGSIIIFPFRYKLKMGGADRDIEAKVADKKKKEKKPSKYKIDLFRLFSEELGTLLMVLHQGLLFVKGVISAPGYYLNIKLNGGMLSPDMTGYLYGGICAAKPMLGKSFSIEYSPDFSVESLGGEINGVLKVRVITLIKELLLLAWRLPKLKLLKILFQIRKGGRYGRQIDRPGIINYVRTQTDFQNRDRDRRASEIRQ